MMRRKTHERLLRQEHQNYNRAVEDVRRDLNATIRQQGTKLNAITIALQAILRDDRIPAPLTVRPDAIKGVLEAREAGERVWTIYNDETGGITVLLADEDHGTAPWNRS